MTTATHSTATAEITEIDGSARCSISLLIVSALLWLVLGGALALLNLLQLNAPDFMAHCPVFTFGRTQAMQETALLYGWAANAGLAVTLWLLARLSGSPLRGTRYLVFGCMFWNVAVLMGVAAIAAGEMSSFSMLELPRYVQPLMLVAFGAMAVPGVLAWTGRRAEPTFAGQWYGVAALFLFPWFFSVAQVMLFYVPVRGTLQAVIATWFAQNVFSLWLAPMALGALYYLVPKISGRLISNYDFAIYGFWSLLLFGSWMGGRQLIGGPVPAWIPTMAIVSGVLLFFHFLIVFVNLRGAFTSGGTTTLKFIGFGLGAYLLGGLIDIVFSVRSLAVVTQFTYFQQAQTQLSLAAFSMIIFGAIYYLAPRLAGAAWPSASLVRAHYLASILGFTVLVVTLGSAGWIQGTNLNDPAVSFATISTQLRPWLQIATAAQALLLVGNLALGIHFVRLMLTKSSESSAAMFQQPSALEANAS